MKWDSLGGRMKRARLAKGGMKQEELGLAVGKTQGAKDQPVESGKVEEIRQTKELTQGLTVKIKQVGDMIDNLFDEYQRYGTITREQFAERNRKYLQEEGVLKQERSELEYRLGLLASDESGEGPQAPVGLEDAWDGLTFEERRRLLALYVKRVVVYRNHVTVETFWDSFDIVPSLIYRNVLYFQGEEPRQNPGMFKRGNDPRRPLPKRE